jgi:hypothetical protein
MLWPGCIASEVGPIMPLSPNLAYRGGRNQYRASRIQYQ